MGPYKGKSYTFTITLFSQTTGQALASPTVVAGDIQVDTDGANSFTNVSSFSVKTDYVEVTLSSAQVGNNYFVVRFRDVAGNQWKDILVHRDVKPDIEQLHYSATQIINATVDTVTNTHTPTTTEFQADDITEATTDHYKDRIIIFTSGNLAGQCKDITGYAQVGGIGQFTVSALTEAPANNDTFVIL
jgi:hypothetical protein